MLIGDKLAYRGSLSASLSQELIAVYRWLAYRVAYRVVASRRCGQRLGGGRRLAGRRRLGGGSASATAAPRSQFGVYLSFSLSFSLSRGLSVLIRGHIQDLCCVDNHSCTKCSVYIYLLCDSIPIRTGPCSLAPMLFGPVLFIIF